MIDGVYLEPTILEVKINTEWESITADVIGSIKCEYGISGSGPLDRIASPGSLTFTLRNSEYCLGGVANYYTPDQPTAKVGWGKGTPIRLRMSFTSDVVKFYGTIYELTFDVPNHKVNVDVRDWMQFAVDYQLRLPVLAFNKKIDQLASLIVSGMPVKPLHTDYRQGSEIFSTAFDQVKENARGLTEFTKLVMSEYSFLYVAKDHVDGETLVVEGRHSRSDAVLNKIPETDTILINQDGSEMVLQSNYDNPDGTHTPISLNRMQFAIIQNEMESSEVTYGPKDIVNRIQTKAYPRKIDTSPSVVFSLNSPIQLGAGQTISNLKCNYRDANGNNITSNSLIYPTYGVDYEMWSNRDGTGIDLSASLTVTATYYANSVIYTLKNISFTNGFVTKLQARGNSITATDPIIHVFEDTESINLYGDHLLTIDQKLQDSINDVDVIAGIILERDRLPRTRLKSITCLANTNEKLMNAFLYCDIGDMVEIIDDASGLNNYYFVNSIKFELTEGNILYYTWGLVERFSLNANYWLLGTVDRGELGVNTILGF